jgi:hypothetical protein
VTLDEFLTHFGSARFWLDATILTGLVGFVWTVVRRLGELALFRLSLRTRLIEVVFHAKADVPPEIAALKCLVIRYGNDTYLREMASDAERFHGRLRNKVVPVRVETLPDGQRKIILRIKMHRRLGTQFKFFVDVHGDTDPVVSYLESHENIHAVEPSPRPGHKKRVFFLVRDYPTVTTVDGFENNMIFPV